MTTSIYVMGDRSTEVSHPASGVICDASRSASRRVTLA